MADAIEALTTGQILRIAATNMLMCRFRFDDEMVWSLLTDHGRGTEAGESSANRLHASILMAGNYGEAMQS